MRGTIGILTGGGPACDGLGEWLEREVPATVQIRRVPGNQIAWQRNLVVEAMRADDGWVLFIDNDVIPPRGGLVKLLAHEVGVVGGIIVDRRAPFDVCALKATEPRYERYTVEDFPFRERALRPVVSVGTGFTLIRRAVFDAVPRPWFRCGQIQVDLLAEDLDFCFRAAQVGFPAWVDPTVRPGHPTSAILSVGDGELMARWSGHLGPLPYEVPVAVEPLRDWVER